MTRRLLVAAAAAGAAVSALAATAAPQESALAALYADHQWFELRDAAARLPSVPVFYRAALACAFHDSTSCESTAYAALAAQPANDQAYELHELLSQFYLRAGRYRRAFAEVDNMLTIRPGAPDVLNARPLLMVLARDMEQETASYAPSALPVQVSNENFPLPISINGKAAQYFFDTGANLSVMSASEARRLGMSVHDVSTRVSNTPGEAVAVRVATADDLAIGRVRLKHVAFLVFRDDEEPFAQLLPGRRGAIGLPVLLALKCLSWGANNQFEIGTAAPAGVEPNLGFDGALPIARASVDGRPVAFNLDTGAEDTRLWPPFASAFPAMVRSGRRGTTAVTGVGSSRTVESVELAQVSLALGGRTVVLAPASVLVKETTPDTRRRFGNLGLDLLNQASRTTIDFRTMTLTLTGSR